MVGEVRGIGAMRGLAIVEKDGSPAQDRAKQLSAYCLAKGLILLVCGVYGNIIRVLMPLTIEDEVLRKGLDIMKAGLTELDRQQVVSVLGLLDNSRSWVKSGQE